MGRLVIFTKQGNKLSKFCPSAMSQACFDNYGVWANNSYQNPQLVYYRDGTSDIKVRLNWTEYNNGTPLSEYWANPVYSFTALFYGTDVNNFLAVGAVDNYTANLSYSNSPTTNWDIAFTRMDCGGTRYIYDHIWLPQENPFPDHELFPNFTYEVEGFTVDVEDTTTGTDPVEHRIWNWGDGNITYEGNTSSHTYPRAGIYGLNLYVNNTWTSNETSKDINIGNVTSYNYHLLLDVVDGEGEFVTNSNIGIYDNEHDEWRNSTCLSGACGFMDSGATHQYPLVFGNSYVLSAQKDDMGSDSEGIEFLYDYQKVTLELGYGGNVTNISPHAILTVTDYGTRTYAQNVNVGIYDPYYESWYNQTVATGIVTFTHTDAGHAQPLVYGRPYHFEAWKTGYREYYTGNETASTDTILLTDYQQTDLAIMPEDMIEQTNYTWDIDYKDSETNHYIEGLDVGIYDAVHDEWRNSTCPYGACGYQSTGSANQYPLQKDMVYKLYAAKSGYYPIASDYRFSPQTNGHMYMIIYLHPLTSPYIFVTPTTPTPFVTVTGNLSPNQTGIPYPEIYIFPTLNQTFPLDGPDWNTTASKEAIIKNIPEATFFVLWMEAAISTIFELIVLVVSIGFLPLWLMAQVHAYSFGIAGGFFNGYAGTTLLLTYSLTSLIGVLPVKVQNIITLILSVDIIRQIWLFQSKLRRLGGA